MAVIHIHIDNKLKELANLILEKKGISEAQAITQFYQIIVKNHAVPKDTETYFSELPWFNGLFGPRDEKDYWYDGIDDDD